MTGLTPMKVFGIVFSVIIVIASIVLAIHFRDKGVAPTPAPSPSPAPAKREEPAPAALRDIPSQRPKCPPNEIFNKTTEMCECNTGFERVQNACVLNCPVGSTRCGVGCYDPMRYDCVNGNIQVKNFNTVGPYYPQSMAVPVPIPVYSPWGGYRRRGHRRRRR